jgi:hypothetical protein
MQLEITTELLERINRGDHTAAQDLYLVYTSYLRVVAGMVLALMLNRSVQVLWGYRVPFCPEPWLILGIIALAILIGTLTDLFTPAPRGIEK